MPTLTGVGSLPRSAASLTGAVALLRKTEDVGAAVHETASPGLRPGRGALLEHVGAPPPPLAHL